MPFGFISRGGRYGNKPYRPPWTAAEDHITRVAVLACGSWTSYAAVIDCLCHLFNRLPANYRLSDTTKYRCAKCDKVVGNRLWDIVVGLDGIRFRDDPIYSQYNREGLPLSFIEQKKLLDPYFATGKTDKPPVEHLAVVAGRRSADVFEEYFDYLRRGRVRGPVFGLEGRVPHSIQTDRDKIERLAREFMEACERSDGGLRAEAWKAYYEAIHGG